MLLLIIEWLGRPPAVAEAIEERSIRGKVLEIERVKWKTELKWASSRVDLNRLSLPDWMSD
jgi:hypothetical protein